MCIRDRWCTKFNADHLPLTSDVVDEVVTIGEFAQLALPKVTHLRRVLDDALLVKDLQRGESRNHSELIALEGR